MRLLLATFLFALSYAQTEVNRTYARGEPGSADCPEGYEDITSEFFCGFAGEYLLVENTTVVGWLGEEHSQTCQLDCQTCQLESTGELTMTSLGVNDATEKICRKSSSVWVNHFNDDPGFYTCDFAPSNDPCYEHGECSPEETNCPVNDGLQSYRDGNCACIGLNDATRANASFPDYGSSCIAHDNSANTPFYDSCFGNLEADICGQDNWCLLEWCYIDPQDADCTDEAESEKYPDNFYSYQACDALDCYTCTLDSDMDCPDGCPIIPDGTDCNCPIACRVEWVGDGDCDERDVQAGLLDCAPCEDFWSGDAVGDGIFDGGDCDLPTKAPTVTNAININHPDIVRDGGATCIQAEGICTRVSFQAVHEATDMSYDCLGGELTGTVSWFVFRMGSDGDLNVVMLSDADVDYIIWGPFESLFVAMSACNLGNLGESDNHQCGRDSATTTISKDGVSTGETFVLMIHDKNVTPVLTSFDNDASTAALDCTAITIPDDFICESRDEIQIDFATATVVRHNLGDYWQENEDIKPNPLVAEGIYYTDIGYYGTDKIGLLVTTDDDDYHCALDNKNGDNMCTHVTTGPFGQINMGAGEAKLKFQFRIDSDAESGDPLTEIIPSFKMTIFDVDSTDNTLGGENVDLINPRNVCPGGVDRTEPPPYLGFIDGVVTGNILDFTDNDFTTINGFEWNTNTGCFDSKQNISTGTFKVKNMKGCHGDAANPGSCKPNNPTGVNDLTTIQQSMAFEAEWTDVDQEGVELVWRVSKLHTLSRNFWFAGKSNSIGRTCCREVVTCLFGYVNGNMECGGDTGNVCSGETCCITRPPSSHGDPIIHTFHGECYDLHKDGNYLASSHPSYDNDVHVAVYNEYMRQVSVTDKFGNVLLAINNFGEIVENNWPYLLKKEVKKCPENYEKKDCIDEYINISFDAQDLYYDIQAGLRHDYSDNGLKEGEVGFHMDIWPQPYVKSFNKVKEEYTGLYFHNPLPEEMPTCDQRGN